MSQCIYPLIKKGGGAKLNICCLHPLFVRTQIMFNKILSPMKKLIFLTCLLVTLFPPPKVGNAQLLGKWSIPIGTGNDPVESLELSFFENYIQSNSFVLPGNLVPSGDQIGDGAFDANYDLDFYMVSDYLFYDSENTYWNTGFGNFMTECQIIPRPQFPGEYYIIYGEFTTNKNLDANLYYNHIWFEDDEMQVGQEMDIIIDSHDGTSIAFAVTDYTDQEIRIYNSSRSFSYEIGNTHSAGLRYFLVSKDGIDLNSLTDVITSTSSSFSESDFDAYNLEHKTEANGDHTIAWINQNEATKSTIYFVIDDEEEYYDLNLGRIGGIEFSSMEDDIIYVSCQDSGIVKIDYTTGNYISTVPGSSNFGHTFLQTAPDGNIYGVIDGGHILGRISMTNGSFNSTYFTIPGLLEVSTFRVFDNTNYYILPENHRIYDPLKVTVQTENVTCPDDNDGFAEICVSGGFPCPPPDEYSLTCYGPMGQVSNIVYKPETNCFELSFLVAGTYTYEVTDCLSPPVQGSFEIGQYTYDYGLIVVDSDLNWGDHYNTTARIDTGIFVTAAATLTIDAAHLEFGPNGRIVIDTAAKIVSQNTTYTSLNCEPRKKWKGIEVWGNRSEPQRRYNGSCPQGVLEIRNCVIEHAENGAAIWALESNNWRSSGGIIKAYGSTFLNNTKAVHFIPYQNFQELPPPIGGTILRQNMSYFKHCTFSLDNYYIDSTIFWKHVDLHGVDGIDFTACDFLLDATTGVAPWNNGIASYGSGFTVEADCNQPVVPCPDYHVNPSTFTGFYRGISAHGSDENINTYSVFDSEFQNNTIGVYNIQVNNAVMVDDTFRVGYNGTTDNSDCANVAGSGIEVFYAKGFAIENNFFSKFQGVPSGNYVGIRLDSTRSHADDVYNNKLTGLSVGNLAEGLNRSVEFNDHTGVAYLCNENSFNYYDFHVAENSVIKGAMGTDELPSGNTLSQVGQGVELQFRNDYTQEINYYWYDGDPLQELTLFADFVTEISVSTENTCPDHYGGGTGVGILLTSAEKTTKQQEYNQNIGDYTITLDLFNTLKDGGDTPLMEHEIKTAWPDEMWVLRADLLANSPHLSSKVLKSVADRTDVFPESVQFEIFAANPDEMNYDFLTYLETKAQPMPQYMVDMLWQVGSGTSYKTVLKNQLATYWRNAVQAAQDIIRSELIDSITDLNEIRVWLGNIGGYQVDKQVVSTYIQEGDFSSAQNLLSQMPNTYSLSGDELLAYNDYNALIQMQINLIQEERSICELDSTELATVYLMATQGYGSAKKQAQSILEYAYGQHFYDCPSLPDSIAAKQHQISEFGIAQDAIEVSIKPNPAQTWVVIDYTLPFNAENGLLLVIDITGHVIEKINLDQNNGQAVLDLRHVPAGVYIYRIESSGYSSSGKLVIQ